MGSSAYGSEQAEGIKKVMLAVPIVILKLWHQMKTFSVEIRMGISVSENVKLQLKYPMQLLIF